ncbi:unnamed protein product [Caenorhabditis auriculariae]|uniref:G protein-coupled receptor n=1 Tax=Caenorhabditis auriculariae TaxID=2777116 RepID=A0A8S1HD71_9PELO|nr:unnamed protein product [Caenorhabditis auriculariae]
MVEVYVGDFPKWMPRIFSGLSFIFNSFLIHIICHQNKSRISRTYRSLLISFCIFDICYSASDLMTGMNRKVAEIAFLVRCSFIGLSYGILELHFIYRYIILCRPSMTKLFSKFYILLMFFFISINGFFFGAAAWVIFDIEETKEFIRDDFYQNYHADVSQVVMVTLHYRAREASTLMRTYLSLLLTNISSVAAVATYFILGTKIVQYLRRSSISAAARALHRQLFTALVVQSSIPFVVSLLPCLVTWFTPLFGVSIGRFNNYYTIPMFSAFPCCDPIAIAFIVAEYRRYIYGLIPRPRKELHKIASSSNHVFTLQIIL